MSLGETSESRLAAAYIPLLGIAAIVIAVDQVVKALVTAKLSGGTRVDVLGGLLTLDYTENRGAAFGVFQSGGWLFVTVALLVAAAILLYYPRFQLGGMPGRLGLGLILGGAVGNLVDRIRLGYVVDFVDLHWWPVFNVADSAIVVGVIVLSLYSLLSPTTRQSD